LPTGPAFGFLLAEHAEIALYHALGICLRSPGASATSLVSLATRHPVIAR